jgi:tetratricopeptide (TPR) repeat protein
MKFNITFKISPSGLFGVPEEGWTVLPPSEITSPALDTKTGLVLGYGSLSKYREEDNAINLSFTLGNVQVRIQDNFFFLEVDSNTSNDAYSIVLQALETFLQHLTLDQARPFTYEALIIESEDGQLYRIPTIITLGNNAVYDLDKLRQDIQAAEASYHLQDSKLERALQYFDHALFISEKRKQIADIFSRHYRYLVTSVFLNLWKAVSTIVGDPSSDRDHQRRYKQFGFDDDFYRSKIKYLHTLRNNYDVAHYSLDVNQLNEIDVNIGKAQSIASEVLRALTLIT